MFHLNLFYEQQELQRARDLDPVRLTALGGVIIVLIVVVYAGFIYLRSGGLRSDLDGKRAELKSKQEEYNKLIGKEGPTDFSRIQTQAQALENRLERRVMFATQLDILREVIPTNCQVRAFHTERKFDTQETIIKGRKGDIVQRKTVPLLNVYFEVETQGKNKVEVLQMRDRLVQILKEANRYKSCVVQDISVNETGSTNSLNRIELTINSSAQDAREGGVAVGIFEFKLPMILKDEPKDL